MFVERESKALVITNRTDVEKTTQECLMVMVKSSSWSVMVYIFVAKS